jgi:hypothetical protein
MIWNMTMKKYIDDVLVFVGCVVIVYGIYRINLTAAILVGGVMLVVAGVLVGWPGKAAK